MKRLLVLVLILAACGGDNTVSTVPPYNADAVSHVAAAMVANGDLRAPNGGPFAAADMATLLQIVKESCGGPGKIQALVNTMGANPYLLAMTMHLVNVGCPKLVADMGIKVGE